jgi:hypothetical protein
MAEATILVPTHSHGDLLNYSVRSALAQTVADIEVFIVGDGADTPTKRVAESLSMTDERVRFFDNPKGPRHGEVHRHAALAEASGRIVAYLSDDDLFLPGHVSDMLDILDNADFAHALPVIVEPDQTILTLPGSLAVPPSRADVVALRNFIPLSCGAHTLEAYRRLPHGWRTTPEGIHTDVYMWSQLLEDPNLVARSGTRVGVIHFPSTLRRGMSASERLDELAEWSRRITDPAFEREVTRLAIEDLSRRLAWLTHQAHADALSLKQAEDLVDELRGRVDTLAKELQDSQQAAEQAARRASEVELEMTRATEALRHQLDWITDTRTWRLRRSVLGIPGVTPIVRTAARARARREAG